MNEKIQNTFKSPNACPKKDSTFYPNPDITSEESVPDLQQFLHEDKTLYLVDEAKWNNQRHLYNDCIQSIGNRDSFILTRGNKVCHQPYQCFYLLNRPDEMKEKQVLDTDKLKLEGSESDDPGSASEARTEGNKYGDNQFFGGWVSFKTTHTISINGTTKDSVPNMFEKIQLVKPWEITPIPTVLRK
jgi:hypothetical protein